MSTNQLGCNGHTATPIIVELANGSANRIRMSIMKVDFGTIFVLEIELQALEYKVGCILGIPFLVQYNPCIDW